MQWNLPMKFDMIIYRIGNKSDDGNQNSYFYARITYLELIGI